MQQVFDDYLCDFARAYDTFGVFGLSVIQLEGVNVAESALERSSQGQDARGHMFRMHRRRCNHSPQNWQT